MPRPPNLVLVLTTQWRSDMLGCAGHPNARTPELDALAARGRRYTQAVTPHPFGPMARAALFTGVPSPRNGVVDYYDPLPLDARTFVHRLREAGYQTAFFGKWHLSERSPVAPLVGEAHARTLVPPERRGGFEFWEGFESGFLLNDPWLHGTRLPEPTVFAGYQSDVLCTRAANWWRENRDGRPVLLVVSLEAPHPPYAAPAPVGETPAPEALHLPANVPRGGHETRVRAELAGYLRHIAATDAAIGRLWREVGNGFEDTRFVFTSVHGDMHGAHGLFRKGWPHEESIRVPLLVAESRSAEASLEERPVSLLHLGAMLESWVRGGAWEPNGEPCAIGMPSVVRLPWQCKYSWYGLRDASRKVVFNERGVPLFFFDLRTDPLEQRNLIQDNRHGHELATLCARARQLAAGFF
ncbi:sulfatase-like hydrolase/transferase [Nibricoccus sp. IMCC34717]|uniref:sulfatase-like hydrolase/transferase n=1 Tax=Nibricoccus sp. IMCC34717 TaxID=3034021 RepID=UPI00384A6759